MDDKLSNQFIKLSNSVGSAFLAGCVRTSICPLFPSSAHAASGAIDSGSISSEPHGTNPQTLSHLRQACFTLVAASFRWIYLFPLRSNCECTVPYVRPRGSRFCTTWLTVLNSTPLVALRSNLNACLARLCESRSSAGAVPSEAVCGLTTPHPLRAALRGTRAHRHVTRGSVTCGGSMLLRPRVTPLPWRG